MRNRNIRLYASTVIGFLLFLGFVAPGRTQIRIQQKPSTAKPANESEECETKYDRFKRKTTITSAPRIIYRSSAPHEELRVSAGIVKDDEVKNGKVKEIELLFQSVAERWRYHNEAEVTFIVDGKRVPAGTAYAMGGVPVMNQVREKMQLTLATEKFLQIINGREVEMKMGPTEIVLKPADLEALRGFAKCAGVSTE